MAGAVSAAAESVRIRPALAPRSAPTGHRGVFRSFTSWHPTVPDQWQPTADRRHSGAGSHIPPRSSAGSRTARPPATATATTPPASIRTQPRTTVPTGYRRVGSRVDGMP
ncbi:hypothetical protein CRV15_32200 (plasmid) [Streptomyces clavuligerus]|uniref:Uncharacterized protein n=1 Tax=Streptomyces clavuligerus TaxID=1901 RepID=B5GMX8_STRCL|nr:hypothetical protein D1794_31505 [Streptomyces clavuligerus]EDY47674.1 hypothetical protein SSCG_00702 [Streptomyces clavuligerus]EFG04333.1 Hypothetical protein SCLAV_p0847 [Streptomyces clavuligerus]QCS10228.1 hypothetical protein CRV15_32200 [Streptomyces clavuligerus]QPJ97725.1 hypothetical protein GE265_32255 [Streptomyces clavuligerus]